MILYKQSLQAGIGFKIHMRQRGAQCSLAARLKGGKKPYFYNASSGMSHRNQNFDLLRYTLAVPAGGVCASPRVCDLHINDKVRRQMSRF